MKEMRIVPPDRRSRIQKVAQLTGDAELGSLALDIFDALLDKRAAPTSLTRLQKYQLGLLATFFDSAGRGALEDVRELAVAHAAAATPADNRPVSRAPTLDDDESRWKLLLELTGEEEDAGRRLFERGPKIIDAVLGGEAHVLEDDFVSKELVPFLDRLAYVDAKKAETEVEGYHSLYG